MPNHFIQSRKLQSGRRLAKSSTTGRLFIPEIGCGSAVLAATDSCAGLPSHVSSTTRNRALEVGFVRAVCASEISATFGALQIHSQLDGFSPDAEVASSRYHADGGGSIGPLATRAGNASTPRNVKFGKRIGAGQGVFMTVKLLASRGRVAV